VTRQKGDVDPRQYRRDSVFSRLADRELQCVKTDHPVFGLQMLQVVVRCHEYTSRLHFLEVAVFSGKLRLVVRVIFNPYWSQ
jgi:hypothetical protein